MFYSVQVYKKHLFPLLHPWYNFPMGTNRNQAQKYENITILQHNEILCVTGIHVIVHNYPTILPNVESIDVA